MARKPKDKLAVTAFSLRCPKRLMEKLKLIAEQNRRSMNREIEMAIAKYVEDFEAANGKLADEAEQPEQLSLI